MDDTLIIMLEKLRKLTIALMTENSQMYNKHYIDDKFQELTDRIELELRNARVV